MKISASLIVLLLNCLTAAGFAAEKPSTKEEIKALVLEDAKKAAKTDAAATAKPAKTANPTPAKTDKNVVALPGPTPAQPPSPSPEKAPVTPEATLPTVEVKKGKITQLDHDLHEQDRKIALEAKNAKSTELDGALNSPAGTVTILGGYSNKVRTGLAQERIELMEFEKDLTEAIAHAKTKEEKAELKKQLEDVRTMRRTLDQPR